MTTYVLEPDETRPLFTVGSADAELTVDRGDRVDLRTFDCFSGQLTHESGKPREVAPYPRVNPLTGPIAIDGVGVGDVVAIHLADVALDRDWGVSTVSPDFGALSATAGSPSLQDSTSERVWIWKLAADRRTLLAATAAGGELSAPLAPFFGTIGVAPAHGEIRTSVHLGEYGGNLDSPLLRQGSTLFLTANCDGAQITVGDGHLTQGDGEFAGTAVEGQLRAGLLFDVMGAADAGAPVTPRLVNDDCFATFGWGRPVDDAFRVALHEMVRWVSQSVGIDVLDAYQLVSQQCEARIANMVNPDSSVSVLLRRDVLGASADQMFMVHDRLAARAGANA